VRIREKNFLCVLSVLCVERRRLSHRRRMRILSITAGAAGMYCGSCLRDNALAVELMARGHEVTLLPLYTPTNPDEANVSRNRVLFGGISIYLQQYVPLFRKTPRFLDRLWDSPAVIRAFASRSLSVDPKMLGDMTVSMLEGDRGIMRKEFDKLFDWLAGEPVPDVVNLPNSLLISLARPLRERLHVPICCTLQGEDLFLEGLVEPYRTKSIDLIRRQVQDVDRFFAVSEYYVPVMARLLGIRADQIPVVPLGIRLDGYERRTTRDEVFRVGYFARIAPEKGLHALAEAYPLFREKTRRGAGAPGGDDAARVRLEVAGYLSREHESYLADVKRGLDEAGLGDEFTYHGAVDRNGKLAFLRTLDVLSVPAPYDEPKGVFLLEAMASGVPVVQPRRGSFTEMVEKTGGGLLVAPDDPAALADGLYALWKDRDRARALGDRAYNGVRAHYSIQRSADAQLAVYEDLIAQPRLAASR
jgi:glycosyltransferase involved in cell wall biosynthesis